MIFLSEFHPLKLHCSQGANETTDVESIGRQPYMSDTDISRIRSAYKCDYHGEGAGQPDKTRLQHRKRESKYAKPISRVAAASFF